MITQKELKELLHYNPDTGIFTWVKSTNWKIRVGDVAGSKSTTRYTVIRISPKNYQAHRLAFLYMTGEFPSRHVDHINHIRDDNRWSNLRQATRHDNMRNTSHYLNNTSGFIGVSWHKSTAKWRSQIAINGTDVHLGVFNKLSDAVLMRTQAERAHNFHPNHGVL